MTAAYARSHMRTQSGCLAASKMTTLPENRMMFAIGFEWTANRNRIECKALISALA